MIEEKEINLDNPIFVYYVNVEGYAPSRVADIVEKLTDIFKYKNVTTWVVPRREGETKIECVYDGRIKERSEELTFLIEEINEKVEILSKSSNFNDFKINIRDWRLKNILK
jgi:hypothetical protein